MKKLVLSVIAAVLTVIGLGGVATISPAYAESVVRCPDGSISTDGTISSSGCSGSEGLSALNQNSANNNDLMGTINTAINVILGVIGFLAVAMIIVGGISFTTSQGDANKTTKARNTILYGVIGLIVALLAFAIVNFILGNVFKS